MPKGFARKQTIARNNCRDERGPEEAFSLFSGNGGLAREAPQ